MVFDKLMKSITNIIPVINKPVLLGPILSNEMCLIMKTKVASPRVLKINILRIQKMYLLWRYFSIFNLKT